MPENWHFRANFKPYSQQKVGQVKLRLSQGGSYHPFNPYYVCTVINLL